MGRVYSPVYSKATGWIVGEIVDHVAKPLNDREQVERACELLNEAPGRIRRAERTVDQLLNDLKPRVEALEAERREGGGRG